MQHDVNKIIDNLSHNWAQDLMNAKKEVAILAEENRLLKEQIKDLKEFSRGTEKEKENAE